jgi:hypothetical protein
MSVASPRQIIIVYEYPTSSDVIRDTTLIRGCTFTKQARWFNLTLNAALSRQSGDVPTRSLVHIQTLKFISIAPCLYIESASIDMFCRSTRQYDLAPVS